MGRITGSASIETLVRVGIEKEHGLQPDSKMVVLHDFTPCVDDELEVHRGQIVYVLYQENDWVYVLSENQQQEGFIPFSYCTPYIEPTTIELHYKKKMPRSGPESSDFNEMEINAETNSNHNKHNTMVKMVASSVDSFCAVNYNNNNTKATTAGTTGSMDSVGVKYLVDNPVENNDNLLKISSEFVGGGSAVSHYQTNYSQMNSLLPKHSYNSMLNIDLICNTPNYINGHTATGPSTAAPSIISGCSNGARSNLSTNIPKHHKTMSIINDSNLAQLANSSGSMLHNNSISDNYFNQVISKFINWFKQQHCCFPADHKKGCSIRGSIFILQGTAWSFHSALLFRCSRRE